MHTLNELSSSWIIGISYFPLDPRQDVYEIKGSCYEKRNNFRTANWPRNSPYTTFRQLRQISEVKMKIREYFLKDRGCMFPSFQFSPFSTNGCPKIASLSSFVNKWWISYWKGEDKIWNWKSKIVKWKPNKNFFFTWYDLAFVYLMNIDIRLKTMQVMKGFERFIFNALSPCVRSLLFGVQS